MSTVRAIAYQSAGNSGLALATLAIIDQSNLAAVLATIAIAIAVAAQGLPVRRAAIAYTSCLLVVLGPLAVACIYLLLAVVGALEAPALIAVLLLAISHYGGTLASAFFSFAPNPILPVYFIITPLLAVALINLALHRWRLATAALLGAALGALVVVALSFGIWLTPEDLTDPNFRTAFVLGASLVLQLAIPRPPVPDIGGATTSTFAWRFVALCLGLLLPLLMHVDKLTPVVTFETGYGKWEDTSTSFEPTDFGRSTFYTYSGLFQYLESRGLDVRRTSRVLPQAGGGNIYVLTMPTDSLSSAAIEDIAQWVDQGGVLFAIADHTDLFGTTQVLNEVLTRFGIEVAADATFGSTGYPNRRDRSYADCLLGHVSCHWAFRFQTGSSFSSIPWTSTSLLSYGLGYTEPADYGAPNRFGPLVPSLDTAYYDAPALISVPYGKGLVVAFSDSTIWSTFALFIDEYRKLFLSISQIAANPFLVRSLAWAFGILVLISVGVSALRTTHATTLIVLLAASVIGIGVRLSHAAYVPDSAGDEVNVLLGGNAKTEFLTQLVGIGDRNYSRALASLQKYGIRPAVRFTPGSDELGHPGGAGTLLIEPNDDDLPSPASTMAFIRAGGHLTALFSPDQVSQDFVQTWLSDLGLYASVGRTNAMTEDPRGDLLYRDEPPLVRYRWLMVDTLSTGMLVKRSSSVFAQIFVPRPVTGPTQPTGWLSISFAADQFSDFAMGEVWEGVRPSLIGRLREHQFSLLLNGRDPRVESGRQPRSLPAKLDSASGLANFIVLRGGAVALEGTLSQTAPAAAISISLGVTPDAYLKHLRDSALWFVDANCSKAVELEVCSPRFLADDLTEWVITYTSASGRITALELLHEKGFSGADGTYRILFSED